VNPTLLGQRRTSAPGRTVKLGALLLRFDAGARAAAEIELLPDGEFWEDEVLRGLCEASMTKWERIRRSERLDPFRVRLPDGSVVWGKRADARAARAKLLGGA